MSSAHDYEIVEVDPLESREAIITFWHANFPGWRHEKLKHFYVSNSHGRAKVWMAQRIKDGSLAGSIACLPRQLIIDGEEHTMGLGSDLGVGEEHRRKGLALRLRKAMIDWLASDTAVALIGTPNDTSARITQRVGYTVLGREVRLVRPLRSRRILESRLGFGPLPKALSPLIDPFLRPRRSRGAHRSRQVELRTLNRFGNEVNTLFSQVVAHRPILGLRSPEWLNWRVFECAYRNFKAIGMYKKGSDTLLGYVVSLEQQGVTSIYDLMVADFEETFDVLLEEFLVRQFVAGSHGVEFVFVGDEAVVNRMLQKGFRMRGTGRSFIVYCIAGMPLRDTVMRLDNWYFTLLDNDA